MNRLSRLSGLQRSLLGLVFSACALSLHAHEPRERETGAYGRPVDRSGEAQVGEASFYGREFFGRTMADGEPMDPRANNAASKSLPLGTRARVTNLETGQSTEVVIQDRGPYVKGRIVDLSPASARAIGLTREQGLAPVEVAPIEVPLPDGGVRLGAGADPTRTMGGPAR